MNRAIIFFLCTFLAVVELKEIPESRHDYEQCWKIVENFCEGNGSEDCTQLIRICGLLLRHHLNEAHAPEKNSCLFNHTLILANRQRTLDDLKKNSENTLSVKISRKIDSFLKNTGEEGTFRSRELKESKSEKTVEADFDISETRRSDIRGMLPVDQAITYPNPLELKKRIQSPHNGLYSQDVIEYRLAFLGNKQHLILNWLANNKEPFMGFLNFWKNSFARRSEGKSNRPQYL